MNILQRRWCLFFLVKCQGSIQIPYNINCPYPVRYFHYTHMGKIKKIQNKVQRKKVIESLKWKKDRQLRQWPKEKKTKRLQIPQHERH